MSKCWGAHWSLCHFFVPPLHGNRAYELEEIFVTSLAEILILRGAVPIEALDRMTGDPARDEQWINELIDNEQVSPGQVAQARAVFAKLPFIELLEYPVDVNAVALILLVWS